MVDAYPQFGAADYSGFTTEEEVARIPARSLPLIDAPKARPAPETRPALALAHAHAPSVSDAVCQLFKSRPTNAIDWLIIFVIIIAIACFLERAPLLFSRVMESSTVRSGARASRENFCHTCGGVVC